MKTKKFRLAVKLGCFLLASLTLVGCDKLTHHIENHFKGMETITTFDNDFLRLSKDKDDNIYLAHNTPSENCGGQSWYQNAELHEKNDFKNPTKPLADYIDLASLNYLGYTHLNAHFQDKNHRYRYQFTMCDSFIFLEEKDDDYFLNVLYYGDELETIVNDDMLSTLWKEAENHIDQYSPSKNKIINFRVQRLDDGYQLDFSKAFFFPENMRDDLDEKELELPEYRMTFDNNGQYLTGGFIKVATLNNEK